MNTYQIQNQWREMKLKKNILLSINDQIPLHYRTNLKFDETLQESVWSTRFTITNDDFKSICQRYYFADALSAKEYDLNDLHQIMTAYRKANDEMTQNEVMHQMLSAVNVIINQARMNGITYPIELVVDYIDKLSIDIYRDYICDFYDKSIDTYANSNHDLEDLQIFYEQSMMMVIGMLVCEQLPRDAQGVKSRYAQYLEH